MRRFAAMAVWVAILAACSIQPKIVQTPVALPCPPPPAAVRPHLPAADLDAYAAPDQVMKALLASLETLKGYAAELEKVLDGYRPRKEVR